MASQSRSRGQITEKGKDKWYVKIYRGRDKSGKKLYHRKVVHGKKNRCSEVSDCKTPRKRFRSIYRKFSANAK